MMENNKKTEKKIKFPQDFLWGASTSAYQIEGGIANDWSCWELSKKRSADLKKRGLDSAQFICGHSCDSYNFWAEDLKAIKELNLNSYRFGLEWARLEPEDGKFDREAVEHYRNFLVALKKEGITTVVTLWHFTIPLWVAEFGGWENKKILFYYSRYVDFICREFGDLIDCWLTLNEPTVLFSNGYLNGKFPPNKKNIFSAAKVFINLLSAHKKAYKIIHSHFPEAKASLTHLYVNYEPARRWLLPEIFLAWLLDFFNNRILLSALEKQMDFIGIDYYFHNRVVWHPPFLKNLNREVNDLGWEIFPKGLYNILISLRRYKKPIIVMENGLADSTDLKRQGFIADHLAAVRQALDKGADVRGYFHWSLLDNFEWAQGWAPKFGLFSIDHRTKKRLIKPSGKFYGEICKSGEVRYKTAGSKRSGVSE